MMSDDRQLFDACMRTLRATNFVGMKPGDIGFGIWRAARASRDAEVAALKAERDEDEHAMFQAIARAGEAEARAKNFHRSLCARFGYTHDETDWSRDLVSLEEHIAGQLAARTEKQHEAVAPPVLLPRFALSPDDGLMRPTERGAWVRYVDVEKQHEADRLDAERYRKLRENNFSHGPDILVVCHANSVPLGHDTFSRERLDVAIDAARVTPKEST